LTGASSEDGFVVGTAVSDADLMSRDWGLKRESRATPDVIVERDGKNNYRSTQSLTLLKMPS
jgi:hypothetical protein